MATAPALWAGRVRAALKDSVEEVLHQHGCSTSGAAGEVIDAVARTLCEGPTRDEVFHAMVVANERAEMQWSLRDDEYLCPDGPEPRSELALFALEHVLRQEEQADDDSRMTPEEAERVLARIEYKGWRFRVLENPSTGGPVIQAIASAKDSRGSGRTVSVSRRGWGRRTLVESAFAAVMQIEEHEARERFRFDGNVVFDPHAESAADPVPELRHRRTTED